MHADSRVVKKSKVNADISEIIVRRNYDDVAKRGRIVTQADTTTMTR